MRETERGSWPPEDSTDGNIQVPEFLTGAGRDHMRQSDVRGPVHHSDVWEPVRQPDAQDFERQPAEPQPKRVTKKQRNKVYGRVAYLFSAMFLALVGYLVYFNVRLADEMRANPNNVKMDVQKQYVVRGSIYSSDGEILAGTNVAEDGTETRVYPYGNVFSHVVGYTTNGKSGVEAIYNTDLLTSSTSIVEQVGKGVKNEKVRGDSLILTLDTDLQQAAATALGAYRGAVVVIEPSTGRILAMVSKPDFDPNYMEENWNFLISEDANSPLLNRATQGLYPPGSTFKIMTALAYIQQHEADGAYQTYTYNCEGEIQRGDVRIHCFNSEAHGYEDLQGSFQQSCNTSFANIGLELDLGRFADLCRKFYFNEDLPTVLPYSSSQFKLNEKSSYGDVMTTSIGQGDTLVTPFHMALITCAIANDGVLMYPYLTERIENTEGVVVSETKPIRHKRLMSAQEAQILTSYMQSVVEGGTAASIWNDSYTAAGKTGSAEYEVTGTEDSDSEKNYSTHSWFVGFSNVEDPDLVVSVIAEDGGTGSSAAVPIAKAVFDTYYWKRNSQ